MHKIRKTYGTTLIDSDVDEGFITEQMGHSDISTTKNYIISAIKQRKIRKNRLKMLSHFRNDYCLTTYLTTLELFKK